MRIFGGTLVCQDPIGNLNFPTIIQRKLQVTTLSILRGYTSSSSNQLASLKRHFCVIGPWEVIRGGELLRTLPLVLVLSSKRPDSCVTRNLYRMTPLC
jgi:hypothetical protein